MIQNLKTPQFHLLEWYIVSLVFATLQSGKYDSSIPGWRYVATRETEAYGYFPLLLKDQVLTISFVCKFIIK